MVIVEFEEPELCRADGCANKLEFTALVLRVKKQFSDLLSVLVLELVFELDDMLQHELLLGAILLVG